MMFEDEDLITEAERRRPSRVLERVSAWMTMVALAAVAPVWTITHPAPLPVVGTCMLLGAISGAILLFWSDDELATIVSSVTLMMGMIVVPAYVLRHWPALRFSEWTGAAATFSIGGPLYLLAGFRRWRRNSLIGQRSVFDAERDFRANSDAASAQVRHRDPPTRSP